MNDESPIDEQFPVRPPPPPLRIHHLLACAAVAAVQMSLLRFVVPSMDQLGPANAAIMAIYQVFGAIGLTLAIFSIYWHVKGYAGLVQPGQWLLISYAISVLSLFLTVLRAMSVGLDGSISTGRGALWILWSVVGLTVYHIVPAAFFAWCAWKVADTLRWRLVFVILAVARIISINVVLSLFSAAWGFPDKNAMAISYLAYGVVPLLFEFRAVADDFAAGRPRFWTHWVGIGLSMIGHAVSVVAGVWFYFMWQ